MDSAEIRELVQAELAHLGFADAKSLGERLLYCDRYYIGVRYAFEGVSAIWLAGAGHLRFVNDAGVLLKISSLHTNHLAERAA